jgi:hypothetical protein
MMHPNKLARNPNKWGQNPNKRGPLPNNWGGGRRRPLVRLLGAIVRIFATHPNKLADRFQERKGEKTGTC